MDANNLLETTLRTEIGDANTAATDAIALLEQDLQSEIDLAYLEIESVSNLQGNTTVALNAQNDFILDTSI